VNSMFNALVVGPAVPELTLGTTIADSGFAGIEFPKPVSPATRSTWSPS
jgi:hypothetical protein